MVLFWDYFIQTETFNEHPFYMHNLKCALHFMYVYILAGIPKLDKCQLPSERGYWNSPPATAFCPQSTAEVHRIPARVQCTVQVCELAVSNLHPPPYRNRQIICLSHSESVRLPPPIADAALPSPAKCRAVPSCACVHGTAAHIIAHCALCPACAPLVYCI
jgi:hypothetical protein